MVRRDIYVFGLLCGFAAAFPLGWVAWELAPFRNSGRTLFAAVVTTFIAFLVTAVVSRLTLRLEPVTRRE